MTNPEIHPVAQAEYNSAIDWYAERSNAAAQRFVLQVEAAIDAIKKRPDCYARLDDTHRVYLLNGFPYYVAYRQVQNLVQIVAIRHSSQDQDAWKVR